MRRLAKGLIGGGLLHSGLYRRLLHGRGHIVAFHRIDDRYPGNPITTSRRDFEAFCRLFRSHFDVVSLADFLDALASGGAIEGKLVITFDDGYRDNHRVAAPFLSGLGLPATFFIATGFIGTERVPWWDGEAHIASEWMTWDEVRELDASDFTLGAHTVNHVDLGLASPDEARREIQGSKTALEAITERTVDLFAYPFGRPHQISQENREVARDLGFRCALSCHGGGVRRDDDPLYLHRVPISPWHRSVGQLAFEMLRA